MDDQNVAVNTAEPTTATESAPETNTTTVEPQGDTTVKAEERTIPYSRFKEVNDQLRELKAKESARTLQTSEGDTTEPSTSIDIDKEIEERLDRLAPVLEKKGFVTERKLTADKEVEMRTNEAKSLMTEYNGENGLPKFDLDEVTAYMKDKRFYGSYKDAYTLIHHDAIVAKAVADATAKKAPSTTTTTGGQVFSQAPAEAGALSREGIAKMSVEEYAKIGGAKGLRGAVLSGQVK